MAVVYQVRNKNDGKVYVGVTAKPDPVERWKEHIKASRRGDFSLFYNAIRKHGEDSFSFNVVSHHETVKEAFAEEISRIALLREQGTKLYNVAPGGNGCFGHGPDVCHSISEGLRGHVTSEETKKKIRDKLAGRKLSSECRKAIRRTLSRSECVARRRKASSRLRHSQVSKDKIAYASRESWKTSQRLNARKKIVEYIDMKTGDVIARFESAHDAARKLRLSQGSISNAARGLTKTAGGFRWRYVQD